MKKLQKKYFAPLNHRGAGRPPREAFIKHDITEERRLLAVVQAVQLYV